MYTQKLIADIDYLDGLIAPDLVILLGTSDTVRKRRFEGDHVTTFFEMPQAYKLAWAAKQAKGRVVHLDLSNYKFEFGEGREEESVSLLGVVLEHICKAAKAKLHVLRTRGPEPCHFNNL